MQHIKASAFDTLYTTVKDTTRARFISTMVVRRKKDESLFIMKLIKKKCVSENFISELNRIYSIRQTDLANIVRFEMYSENEDNYFLLRPFINYMNLADLYAVHNSTNNDNNNGINEGNNLDAMMKWSIDTSKNINQACSLKTVNELNDMNDQVMPSRCCKDGDFQTIWKGILMCYNSLHKSGIFPNFVKINNIFVRESDNCVFVTDVYPLPVDAILNGIETPDNKNFIFLAPEIFTKEYEPNEKSDMWSLGALLLYCLGYTLPWSTVNLFSMVKVISKFSASDTSFETPNNHNVNRNINVSNNSNTIINSSVNNANNINVGINNNLNVYNNNKIIGESPPQVVKDVVKKLLLHEPSKRVSCEQLLWSYRTNIIIQHPNFNLLLIKPKRNSMSLPKPIQIVMSNNKLTKQFTPNMRSTHLPPISNKLLQEYADIK